MALSRVVVIGDGSTKQFAVNFALNYIQTSDVRCRVGLETDGSGNPLYRPITFLSTNLIQVGGATPGAGVRIVFERTVNKNVLAVDYHNGDQMDEDNLMLAQKQAMMAIHEVLDGRIAEFTADINLGGNTVVNIREPIAPSDAATKSYVDNTAGAAAAATAQQAQAAAEAAAALSGTKAAAASTSEANAAAKLSQFDDIYLGAKATDPTLDNKGAPLRAGMLYWNLGGSLRIYDLVSTSWKPYTAAAAPKAGGLTFGGRLTLLSGVSEMKTSQAGKASVIYTEHAGNMLPLYDGTDMVPTAFSEVAQALSDATKSPAAALPSRVYDIFGWWDTSGTPQFRISRGPPWTDFLNRSAGTALVNVKGVWLNAVSITNGPAAQRGTYLGSVCTNAAGTIDFLYGAIAAGAVPGDFNVWNMYNRVPITTIVGDTNGNNQTALGWRYAGGTSNMRVNFLTGRVAEQVKGRYDAYVGANTGNVGGANIGLGSLTPIGVGTAVTTTVTIGALAGVGAAYPPEGKTFITALEFALLAGQTLTWSGSGGGGAIQTGLTVDLWL